MNELIRPEDPSASAPFRSIAREVGLDEEMVVDLAARLQPVRGRLSDDGFEQLVRDIARTKVRFAERDARDDLAGVRTRPRDD